MIVDSYTAPLKRGALCAAVVVSCMSGVAAGEPWARHTIDRLPAPAGADGVRLADANGDGLLDIATGWEEGGLIRVYLNPGPSAARERWPAVTVGRVKSPEDAVLVDLDGDGATDVVSCCEGKQRAVFVHWAPTDPDDYLDETKWKTEPFPATDGQAQWMFASPAQLDGKNGVDLLLGGKNRKGKIGWLQAPADARRLDEWKWRPLRPAGWTMSLLAEDVDGDGDLDALLSERLGRRRGVVWLENPGQDAVEGPWAEHRFGAGQHRPMFLAWADVTGDGRKDVLTTSRDAEMLLFHQPVESSESWAVQRIDNPHKLQNGKAVAVGDVDLDGQPDLVITLNTERTPKKSGFYWMSYHEKPTDRVWSVHELGGPDGRKFDLVELIDLDGDGDLDALTCEERENLGVVWYENPTK